MLKNNLLTAFVVCTTSMSLFGMDNQASRSRRDVYAWHCKNAVKAGLFVAVASVPTVLSADAWPVSASILALGSAHQLYKKVITAPNHRHVAAIATALIGVCLAEGISEDKGFNDSNVYGAATALAIATAYVQPKELVKDPAERVQIGKRNCKKCLSVLALAAVCAQVGPNSIEGLWQEKGLYSIGGYILAANVKAVASGVCELRSQKNN